MLRLRSQQARTEIVSISERTGRGVTEEQSRRGLTKWSDQTWLNKYSAQNGRRTYGKDIGPVELDLLVRLAFLLVNGIPPSAPVLVVKL